jgi:membrane-associated phospholipid phosphatase
MIAFMLYRNRYKLAGKDKISFTSHLVQSAFYKIEMMLLFMVSGLICVARVYLGYHSSAQVAVGILLGALVGRYWIIVMSYLNDSGILDRICSILMPVVPLQNSWWPR